MNNIKYPLISFVILDLALVTISIIRFPAAGLLRALPVLGLLTVTGIVIWLAGGRLVPRVSGWGLAMGIAAGVILGGEVLLEYILLPADNSAYGKVEYGLFLLVLLASGAAVLSKSSRLVESVQVGFWAAVIGSLIWYAILLIAFHLFFGSPQQVQVFRAEGNMEDFARSGMVNYTAFIVQDFFGAGFFHLLLGAGLGSLLGMIGGLAGKAIGLLLQKL